MSNSHRNSHIYLFLITKLLFNRQVLKKIWSLIHQHELLIGLTGFILSFLYYWYNPNKPITLSHAIPGLINWFCVFLIGDWTNRILGEGYVLPRYWRQYFNFKEIVLASFIMNLISDITGSWLLKLWYYPLFDNPLLYLLILAPLGYVLFGFILYVFYRAIKHHFDFAMKKGRLKKSQHLLFKFLIHLQLIAGIIGFALSTQYYYNFVQNNQIIWSAFHQPINAPVQIQFFIMLWFSLFWIFEYLCYRNKKETLTRDLIRGNWLPIWAILVSSAVCISLVEFVNAPFQIWIFTNWPFQAANFLHIPLVAYLVWPTQYLLLLSLIRLFDKNNSENVW